MSTLEDSLHINQLPFDKWSSKEKLYLLSSISDFANPDWMTVSELLVKICANENRPLDWFSKENCARQYNQIIKKHEITQPTESISNTNRTISGITDCPDIMILEELLEERVRELINEIHTAQEEYANLFADIKAVQAMSDDHIEKMWSDIQKEQEMQRVEEMKLENQLRERERLKDVHLQNWNTTVNKAFNLDSRKSTNTSPVDMDVEEIVVGNGKSTLSSNNNKAMKIKSGTSPLLSTLLKSSNTNFNSNHNTNSIRCTAPTITTLLTGGSITNTNHSAILVNNDNIQLQTRPLSGPPIDIVPNSQTKVSPAQSAPTLSLLLEKSKNLKSLPSLENKTQMEVKISKPTNLTVKLDDKVDFTKRKTIEKTISNEIGDMADTIEEQQLLEVFKSIGNIAELDIDVAAVIDDEEHNFLKSVAEETASQLGSDVKLGNENNTKSSISDIPTLKPNSSTSEICGNENYEQRNCMNCNEKHQKSISKNGNVSSDDSNGSIILANDARLDSPKEYQVHPVEINAKRNIGAEKTHISDAAISIDSTIIDTIKTDTKEIKSLSSSSQNSPKVVGKEIMQTKNGVEHSAEIVIDLHTLKEDKVYNNNTLGHNVESVELPVVSGKKQRDNDRVLGEAKIAAIDPVELFNDDNSNFTTITDVKAPFVVCPVDTDDDSSATDASINLRKDEKNVYAIKIPHCMNATKIEDDSNQLQFPPMAVINVASRNNNMRKLRERDRSESPMVDDDTTNTSDYYTSQKLRRLYSSTPVLDSVPNSPASSDRDERELRTSKKTLLSIYNLLYSSKHASSFQKVLNEVNSVLGEVCLRPMDFQSIKRNIESGGIRSVYELQRDILLMCQNIVMVTKTSSINYKIVQTFQKECQSIREFMANGCDTPIKSEREKISHSSLPTTSKSRSGSRKSLRIS